MRDLYILPPHYMPIQEALEWATNEVLRLDAENQRLHEKVKHYEQRQVPTRKK